ncbi:hypothetical protein [Chloroflexus sp. Y-396-1]|nr:hypothetical protein [Chloroflexus sp. Y-396-1]
MEAEQCRRGTVGVKMFRLYRPSRPSVGPIDANDGMGTIGINDGNTIT